MPDTWQEALAHLKLQPTPAGILHAAGHLRLHGAYEEATKAYREVLCREPENAKALRDLSTLYQTLGQPERSNELKQRLSEVEAEQAFVQTERLLSKRQNSEARTALRHCLEIQPSHEGGNYLHAILNNHRPDRAPSGMITGIYNRLAPRYDWTSEKLQRRKTPDIIRELILKTPELRKESLEIADIGCGTGLCAEALADGAPIFHGVDLSPLMLERAARKHLYTELTEADFHTWLGYWQGQFDLLMVGDCFTYQGTLNSALRLMAGAVRDGGFLICSIEHGFGRDYENRANGSFTHSPFYLRRAARQAGFHIVAWRCASLRFEEETPIAGEVALFQKK